MSKPKKFKPPKILSQITELIPVIDMEEVVDGQFAFRTKEKGYLDLVEIQTKDLNAQRSYDTDFDFISLSAFFKAYSPDCKLVCMHYPVDTFHQIDTVDRLLDHMQNSDNEPQPKDSYSDIMSDLKAERQILTNIHDKFESLEFYLLFWGEDKNSYLEHLRMMENFLLQKGLAASLKPRKKIAILRKLYNLPSSLAQSNFGQIPLGIPHKKEYNPWLLHAIQPQGGISFFSERAIKAGDGYEICIHLYDFKDQVGFGWLRDVLIWESAVATVDIASVDKLKSLEAINRSLEEQTSRYNQARHETEKIDARKIYEQLQDLYESMTSMGEVLKYIDIRIYLFDKVLEKLQERTANVITNIESRGYKATVFLEENGWEWQSLLLPYSKQQDLPNRRRCRSLSSEALAAGYPYHYSSLLDPYGLYFGYTPTKGTIIFDPWQNSEKRMSYCAILLGNMGAGKSTAMKKLMKGDAIKGNFIRGFATNKEYVPLLEHYHGIGINLDGTDGVLNILQVYKTDEQEASAFLKHISKVQTWYKFLCPEADTYDLSELSSLLKKLYEKHLGYTHSTVNTQKITGLEPKKYPILSDFLAVIQQEIYQPGTRNKRLDISDSHFHRVEQIELVIRNIVENYGRVFNGHSTLRHFEDEQIVFFNAENLKSYGDAVFDAQLFSALNLLWDNLIHIGGPQFHAFNQGELDIRDAKKYMIYMDEAHVFVNSRKLTAVNYLDEYVRESRKFFGGLTMASQSITDFLKEGSDTAGIEAIKNLFSLAQYKWLLQQNGDTYDALQTAFRGQLPEYYLQEIPKFPKGDCVLLTGSDAIHFHILISDEEKRLFAGGA